MDTKNLVFVPLTRIPVWIDETAKGSPVGDFEEIIRDYVAGCNSFYEADEAGLVLAERREALPRRTAVRIVTYGLVRGSRYCIYKAH